MYISIPRSEKETDHNFAEPGLFVINTDGLVQVVDISNNPCTQTLGPILDGIMLNTPEGRDFVRVAKNQGIKAAVTMRDAPFNDYKQGPKDQQPRKKSELGL